MHGSVNIVYDWEVHFKLSVCIMEDYIKEY